MQSFGIDTTVLDDALRTGSDALSFASALASQAAQQGVPLNHLLSHLENLYAPREPAYDLVRAASIAWADARQHVSLHETCHDPLTDLATSQHLAERLEGIYRKAAVEGTSPAETHAILSIGVKHAYVNELDAALSAIDIAQALRTVFVRDEVIAALDARSLVVLADARQVNDDVLRVVAVLMRRAAGIPSPHLRIESLPLREADIANFLVALSS
ncbi:MAG: hypothetical protein E6Q27_06680 [Aeromicrobium sp.]|nr:MAG: hypothetical protein E6Q27_06680 [Aeromicrobium sp.]